MTEQRARTRGAFQRGMARRVAAVATAGVLLTTVAGCAGSAQEASSVTSVAATATYDSTSAAATTNAATTNAATTNTELSSGSVTVTVGGRQITYNAAYVVDGIDATISGGTYASTSADEVVFLVVNGGSLTLTGATVTKSGDASSSNSQRTADVSDDYNFYGMNSAILVVGEGSTVTVDGSRVFYVTNTTATLALTNVTVDSNATVLASAAEDRWGNSGSNGADATLTVSGSRLTGDVAAGDSSSITVTLTDGATIDGQTSGSVTVK